MTDYEQAPNPRAARSAQVFIDSIALAAQGKPYKVRVEKPTAIPVIADVHSLSRFRILVISTLQRMTVIHTLAPSVRLKGIDHGY
jgi:hypothetical protein